MRTLSIVLMTALSLCQPQRVEAKKRYPPCASATYVATSRLLDNIPTSDLIFVAPQPIVDIGCASTHARKGDPRIAVKGSKSGTKIKATWRLACGQPRPVKLVALIDATCSRMRGKLSQKHMKTRRFSASRLPSCAVTHPSSSAMRVAIQAALPPSGDPWQNIDEFAALVRATEKQLGCSFQATLAPASARGEDSSRSVPVSEGCQAPAGYDQATQYCGPGTSSDGTHGYLVILGLTCMNPCCDIHDDCYGQLCISGGWCSFDKNIYPSADACDAKLLEGCGACILEAGSVDALDTGSSFVCNYIILRKLVAKSGCDAVPCCDAVSCDDEDECTEDACGPLDGGDQHVCMNTAIEDCPADEDTTSTTTSPTTSPTTSSTTSTSAPASAAHISFVRSSTLCKVEGSFDPQLPVVRVGDESCMASYSSGRITAAVTQMGSSGSLLTVIQSLTTSAPLDDDLFIADDAYLFVEIVSLVTVDRPGWYVMSETEEASVGAWRPTYLVGCHSDAQDGGESMVQRRECSTLSTGIFTAGQSGEVIALCRYAILENNVLVKRSPTNLMQRRIITLREALPDELSLKQMTTFPPVIQCAQAPFSTAVKP